MNFSQVALARPVGGHGQDACNGSHDPGDPNSPMYIGNIGLGFKVCRYFCLYTWIPWVSQTQSPQTLLKR